MRLIDADELKKCAIPCEIHNGALTDLCVPLYQINNAPTVEEKSYAMGYQDGAEDGLQGIRPHGKWIKITKDGIMPIEYMCNICGRTVKSYCDEYIITKDFPFCHCGADMRGEE